jgi:hypothetical protein
MAKKQAGASKLLKSLRRIFTVTTKINTVRKPLVTIRKCKPSRGSHKPIALRL